MPTHPNVRRCIHTKVDGGACGAPAMKGKTHCRFHHHTNHLPARFVMPPLEDPNAIQVTIMEVIRALMEKRMERPIANTILYALQIAHMNLPNTSLVVRPEDQDDEEGESLVDLLMKRLDAEEAAAPAKDTAAEPASVPPKYKPNEPWTDPKLNPFHPDNNPETK
jgi:hypothetical protein